jgi:hypothetical protein
MLEEHFTLHISYCKLDVCWKDEWKIQKREAYKGQKGEQKRSIYQTLAVGPRQSIKRLFGSKQTLTQQSLDKLELATNVP